MILCIFSAGLPTAAQIEKDNTGSVLAMNFSYGISFPGGDLADRFGQSFVLGMGTEYIFEKSSYILGWDGYFQFGTKVKEDVLTNLRSSNGEIIGIDGSYADIFLRQRGLFLGFTLGKIVSFSNNPKSGFRISFNPGIYAHYIRILDENKSVPQLRDPLTKGYDRLARGFAIKEFIGYQHMGTDQLLNFFAGIEFLQASTSDKRPFTFDFQEATDQKRLELSFQIRLGVILPFYR